MKATRFMRKPFIVMGYQVLQSTDEDGNVTGDNMGLIAKWCEGHVIRNAERSFIRVPVYNPKHPKHTEASLGDWILMSKIGGRKSFKVYTEDSLQRSFFEIEIDDIRKGDEIIDDLHSFESNRVVGNVRALPPHAAAKINFRAV